MPTPLRFGLVGCGRVAHKHLAALRDIPEAALAFVVDAKPEFARKALAEVMGATTAHSTPVYDQLETALEAQGTALDAVAITTPSGLHAQQALQALAHPLHVLLEKPMTLSLADATALMVAEKQAQKSVGLCHIYRFFPLIRDLREAIRRGDYGPLIHAQIQALWGHDEAYYRQGGWRGTWAQDGGALMNQTVHAIDLIFWLLGDQLAWAEATLRQERHQGIEAEDFGLVQGGLRSGASFSLLGTTASSAEWPSAGFDLLFQEGRIQAGLRKGKPYLRIDGKPGASHYYANGLKALLQGQEAPTLRRRLRALAHPHHGVYEDFIQAVQAGRPPRATTQDGYHSVEAILGFYTAAREEKRITFPLSETVDSTDFTGWSPPKRRMR